tara:strand:+ start:1070 stop:1516 length:447 start_codon:yes stop_codon:yes gene_type:complete
MTSSLSYRKPIKNVWGWLEEITLTKSPSNSFSEEEWGHFNAYTLHKALSMNLNYLDIANLAQKFNPQDKSQIYSFYKEFIPKKKTWSKWIKSQMKSPNKELVEHLSFYFETSKREAISHIKLLDKPEILRILHNVGIDEKEAKKLLKK